MRYGSVCSGIEAASVAWQVFGWEAAWLAEIEPFPSAVLTHHYPDVPNLGDMTTLPARILAGEVEAPDILVGGTPCQSFSVAGLRQGLEELAEASFPVPALLLRGVPRGDVHRDAQHARGLAVGGVLEASVGLDPPDGAIVPHDPEFGFEHRPLLRGLPEQTGDPRPIVRMHQIPEVLDRPRHGLAGRTEDLGEIPGADPVSGREIPVPRHGGGGFESELEALLGQGQGRRVLAAVRQVGCHCGFPGHRCSERSRHRSSPRPTPPHAAGFTPGRLIDRAPLRQTASGRAPGPLPTPAGP